MTKPSLPRTVLALLVSAMLAGAGYFVGISRSRASAPGALMASVSVEDANT